MKVPVGKLYLVSSVLCKLFLSSQSLNGGESCFYVGNVGGQTFTCGGELHNTELHMGTVMDIHGTRSPRWPSG